MSNIQLYFAIGFLTLLVLLGIISNNSRLGWIETAVDSTNKRLDTLIESIGQLRERVALVEQHR